jgi:hypothetical protein
VQKHKCHKNKEALCQKLVGRLVKKQTQTKEYMVLSRHQNAGHRNLKTTNKVFGEKFKYLGWTVTNHVAFTKKLKD